MSDKRKGLGRGLSALMSDVAALDSGQAPAAEGQRTVPIDMIHPNPRQPRRDFDPEKLKELAGSITERGIIQPLVVRPHPQKPGEFELVAGERRWRAAQMAQMHEVPAVVREVEDVELLELAILENIQREDLNPVEEAQGYRELIEAHGHTQEELARVLGKSRSHIANTLRLLQLPDLVISMLREGMLSAGHARALLAAESPEALAHEVITRGLSVRETERLAKAGGAPGKRRRQGGARKASGAEKDADTLALEGDLSAALGMAVRIRHEPGTEEGQVIITYRSLDQLDELCRILSQSP